MSLNFKKSTSKKQMPFYKTLWFMWLTLFLFPPVGIFLMWKFNKYGKKAKIIFSILFGVIFLVAMATPSENNKTLPTEQTKVESSNKETTEASIITGWQDIDGKRYYYDENGDKITGWFTDNNSKYYLDNDGVMQTGWIKLDDHSYFLNESGAMQTGWINSNSNDYYLNESGIMQTGWINSNGNDYYLNESGVMQTGWIKSNGNDYYLNESGVMQTGWVKSNGHDYYLNESGVMQTGWIKSNGNDYYLDSNGKMLTNNTIDGYTLSSNGVATKQQATSKPASSGNSSSSSFASASGDVTTNEPAPSGQTVYWTPGGKSYHSRSNCSTLSRSKTINSGPASSCPKSDPCNVCVK